MFNRLVRQIRDKMKEELLDRYLKGETNEQEDKQILEWLDEDPANHIKKINQLRYVAAAAEHYVMQTATERRTKAPMSHTLRKVGYYAAGIAAAVMLLMGMWLFGQRITLNEFSSRTATMEVPPGQHIKMTLEDGTNVWLNAGSKLEYPAVFKKGLRHVKISGEAMFEIEHDSQRPFIVETFTSKIEVLGTKFNVFADEMHNKFSTTLIEGQIKVTNLNNPGEVLLMFPKDMVSLVDGYLYKEKTPNFADLCWVDGLIYIKKMPFDELMLRFEKAYDVKIVIDRETMPKINVIGGEIRISDGIDYAFHVLQQVSDFTYERDETNNLIVIK